VKLYGYFRSSAAYRVRIALALKEVAYDSEPLDLRGGAQRDSSYRALNPQGLVPALDTGERVIAQSLAILEYLEETHPEPPLLPPSASARARVRQLAALVACDIHPLNNLRVLEVPRARARRRAGGARALDPALDRDGLRRARVARRGRARDRTLLPRRRADARRRMPGAAAVQRAPLRLRARAVPDARGDRRTLPGAAGLRGRGSRAPARRGLIHEVRRGRIWGMLAAT
jgi:glutathione S-transferase